MNDSSTMPIRDGKALLKIRRARTALLLKHPFFASLAMRLQLREDYHCHTAWTDGRLFAYNPHYINMLSGEKLMGLTAHIVMHPACNHHRRRQHRDPSLWNRACDYVINDILLDAGLTLPDGYLHEAELVDCSAEKAYDIIHARSNDKQEQDTADAQEEGKGQENEAEDEQEQEGESAVAGENEGDENGKNHGDPGMSGEIRDEQEGSGEGEAGEDRTNWDEAVVQATMLTRDMGSIPAGLERFLEDKLSSRLSWRELLARFIVSSAKSDYSWLYPNTRYLHQNLYFPSLKNHELDEMVLALDTSGSIGKEDLEQFVAEVGEILALHPARLHLLCCDKTLNSVEVFERGELPGAPILKGGGGTDFRPVFEYVERSGITPACLIYLTDLECLTYPPHEPPYPVLWAKVGNSGSLPPYGEIVQIV